MHRTLHNPLLGLGRYVTGKLQEGRQGSAESGERRKLCKVIYFPRLHRLHARYTLPHGANIAYYALNCK